MKISATSLARAVLALWTAFTALYAAVCGVPFAWTQFLKEGFLPGPAAAALRWHPALSCLVFVFAAWVLARKAWGAVAFFACAYFIARPLARLTPGTEAAILACAAAWPLLLWEILQPPKPEADRPAGDPLRRLRGVWTAAFLVSTASILPAIAPLGLARGAAGLLIATAAHLSLFTAFWALTEAAPPSISPKWWSAAGRWAFLAILFGRYALPTLGIPPADAWLLSFFWSAAASLVWSAARSQKEISWALRAATVAAVLGAAWSACLLKGQDWNGLVSGLLAAASWPAALCACRFESGEDRPAPRRAAGWALGAVALLCAASWGLVQADPLLRPLGLSASDLSAKTAAVDSSLRLALRTLTPARSSGGFFERLQRNTNLPRGEVVAPVEINLVEIVRRPSGKLPHVFLIVVDSLRRDYVGAYNPAVKFTPALDALAQDGAAWPALTAYGGTGLSEPAIWAGASLIHKQYVTPFAPMNALDRLLRELGYERYVTKDVILAQLLEDPSIKPLDSHTTANYKLCATLDELAATLPKNSATPLFVYTQPQDIHVSVIDRESRSNVTGKPYPGFDVAYASRVERLDACVGKFVAALKTRGLWEDSILIVTSDHGDALGEGGRWGHAYSLHPEVLRVPLIMRLPPALKKIARLDLLGPAFTTDLTPTLYQLLGQGPPLPNPLFGRPLASLSSDPKTWRKAEQLVAASYGPVWGLIKDGRSAFIADGSEFKYRRFDLATGREAQPTPEETQAGRNGLSAWLDRLDVFWKRSNP